MYFIVVSARDPQASRLVYTIINSSSMSNGAQVTCVPIDIVVHMVSFHMNMLLSQSI